MSTSPSLLDRMAVGGAWNPKLVCAVSFLLVFLWAVWRERSSWIWECTTASVPPPSRLRRAKPCMFERMQKELDLTPAQSEQVKSILNDFWQFYRSVLSEGRGRIDQVLTPEQRVKFERLLQEQKR